MNDDDLNSRNESNEDRNINLGLDNINELAL